MRVRCYECGRASLVDSDAYFCQMCGKAFREYVVIRNGTKQTKTVQQLVWDETMVLIQWNKMKNRIVGSLYIISIVSWVLNSQPTPVQYSGIVFFVSLGSLAYVYCLNGLELIRMAWRRPKIREIGVSPDVVYDRLISSD